MHFRLRNIALGHGPTVKPTVTSGLDFYNFEAPSPGISFRAHPGTVTTRVNFAEEASYIHFSKNTKSNTLFTALDTDAPADDYGVTRNIVFRKYTESGANEYAFAGTLTVDASALNASPANWYPDGYAYFRSYGTVADSFWDVFIRAVPSQNYTNPLNLLLDVSGYPGALLSNTHYQPNGAVYNHPLPFSTTGTVKFTVGDYTTPPVVANSHPDVARQAIQNLPSVQAAGLAVKRTEAEYPETKMLRDIYGAWQFYVRPLFTGYISNGTFTLTWNGATTSPISMSASSAEIAAAVNNLSTVKSKGYCTISRLRRGLWSEDGYNPDDCADNGAVSFRLIFHTS